MTEKCLIILLTFLAVVALIVQLVALEYLQQSNRGLAKELQSDSSEGLDAFFIVIDEFTNYVFLVLGPIDFVVFDRHRGLMGTILGFGAVVANGILKSLICQPRPYWIYDDVRGIQCSDTWGSPSGHAMMAISVLSFYGSLSKSNVFTFASLLVLFLVGLDRVYLGLHSYYQVLFGYVLGLLMSIAVLLVWLKKSLLMILMHRRSFVGLQCALMCIYLVCVLIYLVRDPDWDSDWSLNYKRECGKDIDSEDPMFESLAESAVLFIVVGLTLGYNCLTNQSDPQFGVFRSILAAVAVLLVAGINIGLQVLCEEFLPKWAYFGLRVVINLGIGFQIGWLLPVFLKKIL